MNQDNKISAVYPGSFDPVTNGHVYIAERAASIFDDLTVSILYNEHKSATFSVQERIEMAREALKHLKNVKVDCFEGLLVDYMKHVGSRVIIRGLRAMSDFEYEFQIAELETFFIVTDPKYSYVSSSGVREVFHFGGTVQGLVPDCVFKKLSERFNIKN